MKKELKHISLVNSKQITFCARLGLDVEGDTISMAVAKIHDLIDRKFFSKIDLGRPTEKQIQLARKFGYDISGCTRREGDAVISDIMTELNLESIEDQQIKSGVAVINKWDQLKKVQVISSIQEDGLVFFKGGNGKRAWGRNLVKADSGQVAPRDPSKAVAP